MLIVRMLNALWTYCQNCMVRQNFVIEDGRLVCEVCKKPLTRQAL